MNIQYRVETRVMDTVIEQQIEAEANGLREILKRRVMDTTQQHVREALIKLGWTPPATQEAGA